MRRPSYTEDTIEKMYQMYKSGINSQTADRILDIPIGNSLRYFQAFRQVESECKVCADLISVNSFKKLCDKNNLNVEFFSKKNKKTLDADNGTADSNDQTNDATNCVNDNQANYLTSNIEVIKIYQLSQLNVLCKISTILNEIAKELGIDVYQVKDAEAEFNNN